MVPKLDDAALSPDHASYCRDVKFSSERLEGFSGPRMVKRIEWPSTTSRESIFADRIVERSDAVAWKGNAVAVIRDSSFGLSDVDTIDFGQHRIGSVIPTEEIPAGTVTDASNAMTECTFLIRERSPLFGNNAEGTISFVFSSVINEPISRWGVGIEFSVLDMNDDVVRANVAELFIPLSLTTNYRTAHVYLLAYPLYRSGSVSPYLTRDWLQDLVAAINRGLDPSASPTDDRFVRNTSDDGLKLGMEMVLVDMDIEEPDPDDLTISARSFFRDVSGDLNTYFPFAPEEQVEDMGVMRPKRVEEYDWLRLRGDVSVLRGPVPSDDQYRTYMTRNDGEDQRPQVPSYTYATSRSATGGALAISGGNPLIYPGVALPLGVPAPETAPAVAVELTDATAADVDQETRVYAYSYVTELGEEGPLSPPSSEVVVSKADSRVKVTMAVGYATEDSARFASSRVSKIRLYRAATGSETGTSFFLAREIDISPGDSQIVLTGTTGTRPGDSLSTSALGGPAVSQLWQAPPRGLHSLANMSGGFMIGAAGNQLYMSELNLPHAWNSLLAITLPYDVIGIGSFGVSAVAFTREDVYLISGTTPETLSTASLRVSQGCLSRRGIVSLGYNGVIFPSPDGLYHVHSGGYENLTDLYFERNQWVNVMSPKDLVGAHHDRMYFGFYRSDLANEAGDDLRNFAFDPRPEGGSGLTHLSDNVVLGVPHSEARIGRALDGVYSEPLTDRLLVFAYNELGIDVMLFDDDDDNPVSYEWHSKLFDAGRSIRFRWGRVHLFDGTVNLRIQVDGGDDIDLGVIADNDVFGIPPEVKGRFFRIKLEGVGSVRNVVLAETQQELRLEG